MKANKRRYTLDEIHQWYSARGAAEKLKVSRQRVYQLASEGNLDYVMTSVGMLFFNEPIDAIVAEEDRIYELQREVEETET